MAFREMRALLAICLIACLSPPGRATEYAATITSVHDGDTVAATIHLGLDVDVKAKLRFDGVDCPEISTPEGKTVRDDVKALLEGKLVAADIIKKEKYGRYLAVIKIGDLNLNEWLISTGRAKEYHGGKR